MGEGDGPKYINTQDCELFSKRRVVYNADRAVEAGSKSDGVRLSSWRATRTPF